MYVCIYIIYVTWDVFLLFYRVLRLRGFGNVAASMPKTPGGVLDRARKKPKQFEKGVSCKIFVAPERRKPP